MKTIFSGIQPSGNMTLGNYLGAINHWSKMQEEYQCYFSIVDLHSLTIRQDANLRRNQAFDLLAQLVACGIDPKKSTLFFQSHVNEHAALSWLLSCYTYMGELSRMTQFKEKSEKHSININGGLFTYPVLMAADILLYQTELVPVGADQKQHLELARNIAIRFNERYGPVFKVPEPYIPKTGARIMSLTNPLQKMSKSDPNPNSYISLTDSKDIIIKKFKKAVTDSENIIKFDENNPAKAGINNLLNIYSSITNKTLEETEKTFEGFGYGNLKLAVGEVVSEKIDTISKTYKNLDGRELLKIINTGANKAREKAEVMLRKVYDTVGLLIR